MNQFMIDNRSEARSQSALSMLIFDLSRGGDALSR
jgi:hypothetical protein